MKEFGDTNQSLGTGGPAFGAPGGVSFDMPTGQTQPGQGQNIQDQQKRKQGHAQGHYFNMVSKGTVVPGRRVLHAPGTFNR